MKNKRGFTLIELLAVIVILAIIALIAVPIILNMINNARKSAAKSSALGYIDAIEYNNGFAQLEKAGYTEITGEDLDVTEITVKLKGKKPSSGTVTINDKGKVTSATDLCFNGYAVDYDGQDVEINGKCNSSSIPEPTPTIQAYNPGDALYFDPVTTNKCDSTTFSVDAIKNNTSTCYKWRVIDVDDTTSKENITVQLDHNLVNKEKWSPDRNSTGPTVALVSLSNATSTWTRVPALNYTYDTTLSEYDYGILTCTNGSCYITGNDTPIATNVKARLITGEEIKALTLNAGATSDSLAGTWTLESLTDSWYYFSKKYKEIGTQNSGTGNTSLSWLIENTREKADSESTANIYSSSTNNGYWTLSPTSYHPRNVWTVIYEGHFGWTYDSNVDEYGLRPVITMPKSVFK